MSISNKIEIIHCQSLLEEAKVASLIIREAAGKKKKIALITHNKKLSKMAALLLRRWNINIEVDSTLFETKEATFLLKILQIAEHGSFESAALLLPNKTQINDTFENLKKICRTKIVSTKKILEEHLKAADKIDGTWLEHNENMSEFIVKVRGAIAENSLITPLVYKQLLISLLKTEIIRAKQEDTIIITTPIEARLLNFDKVILADLNESGWTPKQGNSSEKSIGQSYHDFISLLSTKEVVITRNKETGNCSRWLIKIEAELPENNKYQGKPWPEWSKKLDEPDSFTINKEKAPKPPRAARPRIFSASDVGNLLTNPYAFYAKKILKLEEYGAIEVKEFGILTHKALDLYVKGRHQTCKSLLEIGEELLAEPENPEYLILRWYKFKDIAKYFVEETKTNNKIFSEVSGSCEIINAKESERLESGETIELTAICDRLEISTENANIIDYKTGSAPTKLRAKEISQLIIEAIIAQRGGFLQKKLVVDKMSCWYLQHKITREVKIEDMEKYLEPIKQLLLDAATDGRFLSIEKNRGYSPYAHLARK